MTSSSQVQRTLIFLLCFFGLVVNAIPATFHDLERRVVVKGKFGFRESDVPSEWSSASVLKTALKTGKSKAVFWSGRLSTGKSVYRTAQQIADEEGLSTLEIALAKSTAVMPSADLVDAPSKAQWELASKISAEEASGDVIAILGRPLGPDNVYERIELPALKSNPRVTSVQEIDANTHKSIVAFSRKSGSPAPRKRSYEDLESSGNGTVFQRQVKRASSKVTRPVAKAPAAKKPVVAKPASVKPPVVKPAAPKPPAAAKPPAPKPPVPRPAAGKPPVGKPASGKPLPASSGRQRAALIPDCQSSVIRCR